MCDHDYIVYMYITNVPRCQYIIPPMYCMYMYIYFVNLCPAFITWHTYMYVYCSHMISSFSVSHWASVINWPRTMAIVWGWKAKHCSGLSLNWQHNFFPLFFIILNSTKLAVNSKKNILRTWVIYINKLKGNILICIFST